jgi:hypothetical protein
VASKSTKAEVERRVAEVAELLLNRVPRRGIQQHAARQGWGGNVRSVDTIIARATEQIRELARRDVELELGKATGALEMLFAKAIAKGDLRTARLVQRDLTELLGLAAPQRLEVGGGFSLDPFTVEELSNRFQELVLAQAARLRAARQKRAAQEAEADGNRGQPPDSAR